MKKGMFGCLVLAAIVLSGCASKGSVRENALDLELLNRELGRVIEVVNGNAQRGVKNRHDVRKIKRQLDLPVVIAEEVE